MSTEIIAGWLKDNDGNKFSPKTLASQVINDDGTPFNPANFAPAGYGLGLETPNQINDCNNAKETGFYRYTAGAANAPSDSGEWLETISYSSTYKYQRAFVSYTGSNIAERWMKGGVWQPWGWVNPPMVAGVEYRTTECWNGNPVYTALISYGKGPSSGACNINLSTVIGLRVVYVEINCKGVNANGWGKFLNQYMGYNEGATGSGNISLSGAGDLSDQDIYLTVKYCKA